MENHRTSDHIFTWKTLINRYVHKEPRGKIYACFVDFRKAFDSVWHNGLFHKLEKLNITGNFLSVLKNMYSQTLCSVKRAIYKLEKTKCLTFQKKNKVRHTSTFYVQNTALENVAEYTYLGITINCNGSFRTALVDLRNKANRAFFSLNSKFQFKKLPIRICLKLFDSLLSPILLYCSEVWASFDYMDLNKWDACEIEKMHLNFCKRILGVNRSTSTRVLVDLLTPRILLQKLRCIFSISHVSHLLRSM